MSVFSIRRLLSRTCLVLSILLCSSALIACSNVAPSSDYDDADEGTVDTVIVYDRPAYQIFGEIPSEYEVVAYDGDESHQVVVFDTGGGFVRVGVVLGETSFSALNSLDKDSATFIEDMCEILDPLSVSSYTDLTPYLLNDDVLSDLEGYTAANLVEQGFSVDRIYFENETAYAELSKNYFTYIALLDADGLPAGEKILSKTAPIVSISYLRPSDNATNPDMVG